MLRRPQCPPAPPARDVPVLDDHQPAADALAQHLGGGARHGEAGLARPYHPDALDGIQVVIPLPHPQTSAFNAQVAQHRGVRVDGVQRSRQHARHRLPGGMNAQGGGEE